MCVQSEMKGNLEFQNATSVETVWGRKLTFHIGHLFVRPIKLARWVSGWMLKLETIVKYLSLKSISKLLWQGCTNPRHQVAWSQWDLKICGTWCGTSCYPSDVQNFEVASRFLENICNPYLWNVIFNSVIFCCM